jgi:hypothetical protein
MTTQRWEKKSYIISKAVVSMLHAEVHFVTPTVVYVYAKTFRVV